MTNYGHSIWHSIANSDQFSKNAPEMATYVLWRQLVADNMAFNGPVWPVVGNGSQLWSRISSLNELVHFKAELRNLGLVYQIMACTALWDKNRQIWSKVAYNGPIFVIVSRYDSLGPYVSLYYHFLAILALSVRFDHIAIKVPGKRESGEKLSIIIQYVLL